MPSTSDAAAQSGPGFPDHVAAPRGKRRLSLFGCLLVFAALAAVTVLLAAVSFIVWQRAGANRIARQLDGIRAKGEPITAAELDAYYAGAPEGEDPTELWLAAIAVLDSPTFHAEAKDLPVVDINADKVPPPGQEWPQLEEASQLLARYTSAMETLHEAANMPRPARFDLRFELGINMQLPHVQSLRGGARALDLEARVRAHRGDARGTADSIRAILAVSRCLENEPVLVSQLVGVAFHGVAVNTLKELLPHLDLSDDELRGLQLAIRATDFRQRHRRALIGERAIGFEILTHPESLRGVGVPSTPVVGNDDRALYLDLVTRLINASDRSWVESRVEGKKVAREMEEKHSSPVGRVRYQATLLFLPAVEMVASASARASATQATADTALAVRRYELKHGAQPRQLVDLVPEYLPAIPADPFDGQPLRMVVGDKSVRIYSIGEDLRDDGGLESAGAEPDVVFEIPFRASP